MGWGDLPIDHRIIDGDLFPCLDVPNRDDVGAVLHTSVRSTRVIDEVTGFRPTRGRNLPEAIINL